MGAQHPLGGGRRVGVLEEGREGVGVEGSGGQGRRRREGGREREKEK